MKNYMTFTRMRSAEPSSCVRAYDVKALVDITLPYGIKIRSARLTTNKAGKKYRLRSPACRFREHGGYELDWDYLMFLREAEYLGMVFEEMLGRGLDVYDFNDEQEA